MIKWINELQFIDIYLIYLKFFKFNDRFSKPHWLLTSTDGSMWATLFPRLVVFIKGYRKYGHLDLSSQTYWMSSPLILPVTQNRKAEAASQCSKKSD